MSKEIEEVRARLYSQSEEERLAALSETLNYGQQGLELLIERSLNDKSEKVKQVAYKVFLGDNSYHTGTTSESLSSPTDIITSLAISPDNTILVGGSWKKIWVWNLQSGQIIRTIEGHSHWISSVAISPDGNTLVSGSADKNIKVWNLKTGQLIRTLNKLNLHSGWITAVAITPDGKSLVSGSTNKTIKIWELNTGKLKKTLDNKKELSSILCLCITADGKFIACGSTNNKITLWDLENYKFIRSLEGHNDWVRSLSITSDNTTLISGSRNGFVKFWQSQVEESPSHGLGSIILGAGVTTAIGFTFGGPIGALIGAGVGALIGVSNNSSTPFPAETLKCVNTLTYQKSINSLDLHRKQNILVVGYPQSIIIFDLKNNTIIYTSPKQSGFVSSVAVDSDGKIVAFAGKDWVNLLNSKTGKPLHLIRGCSYPRLNKISILESSQQLVYGQSKYFTLKGVDENGRNIILNDKDVQWEATGGRIEQALFTAGEREGAFEVKAKIGVFEASIPITILEPPRITNFSITPSSVTLEFGKTQHFTAEILDQRGNPMQETVLWEVTGGGTIEQNGKFIAGNTQGQFEIIASVSSIRRVAPITIIEPPKLTELIIKSSISQLEFSQSFQFEVQGRDQYGNNLRTGELTWSSSGGTIDKKGRFYAGNLEETVSIKATIGDIFTCTEIKVCEPSRLTEIRLIPSSVTLKPGQEQNFCVVAFNQRGEEIAVRNIKWNATDGLINQAGYFSSREYQKGYCQVSATVESLSAKAEVFIPPVLREFKISPEQVELKPEEEFTFSIRGFDQAGDPIQIRNVIWTTTAGGTITYKGIFKGNYKKREVTVTATVGNFSATVNVILLPVLRRLEIQPGFVYLQPGEQQTFVVKGFDQFGGEIDPGDVYWTTTGGKINQDGTLIFERYEQGYFQVTATSQLAPKHTQDVKTLLLYTGIASRIISYLISYETPLQNLFYLDSDSTDIEEQLLDINTEADKEKNTIVKSGKQLDIEVEQATENDTFIDTNVVDLSTALKKWFLKKLPKLVARVFLSISRFCLSEASANLSASADVFVLALEFNPYKYFECIHTLYSDSNDSVATAFAITSDGKKLVSSHCLASVKVWDLTTGELLNTLNAGYSVLCVAITPDDEKIISSGWNKNIQIWNLNNGEIISSLSGSSRPVGLIPNTLNSYQLISGEENVIKIWNLEKEELEESFIIYKRNLNTTWNKGYWYCKCSTFNFRNKEIITSSKIIKSYNIKTGKIRSIIGYSLDEADALVTTKDGKKVVSSDGSSIKIWDLNTKTFRPILTLESHNNHVYALAITSDGNKIVSGGGHELYESSEFAIEIWDINTGVLLHSIEDYSASVHALTITPDGRQIISGHGDGTIRIWGIPELSL